MRWTGEWGLQLVSERDGKQAESFNTKIVRTEVLTELLRLCAQSRLQGAKAEAGDQLESTSTSQVKDGGRGNGDKWSNRNTFWRPS